MFGNAVPTRIRCSGHRRKDWLRICGFDNIVDGLTRTANSILGKAVLPTISNRSVVAKRSVAVVHNVVAAPSSEKPVINKPAVKCRYCKRQHSLKNCYKFKDLTYRERKDFLRAEKPCFECCEEGHLSKDCPRRCESKERGMVQAQECARQAPQLAKGKRPTKDLRPFFLQSEMNDSLAE